MAGVPKTEGKNFFEELNRLTLSQAKSELVLKQFERRAQSILKCDAALGYEALGAISALREDTVTMRAHHENAIRLNRGGVTPYTNYATSLSRCGFLHESLEVLKRVYSFNRSDPQFVRRYMGELAHCALMDRAAEVAIELERLKGDARDQDVIDAKRFGAFFRERGINENDTSKIVLLATDVLHRNGLYRLFEEIRLAADEESQFISYEMRVEAGRHMLHRILEEFVEAVVEADINPIAATAFSVRFSAVPEEAEEAKKNANYRAEFA